jgi:ribosomal protein L29
LDKEREEIEARLAELEAELVRARHVEMTTGMAVASLLAAMEAA